MKEIRRQNDGDVIVYDCGIRDVFNEKCEVWYHTILRELRLMQRNKDYRKQRQLLDRMGHINVYTPKYGQVIDVTKSTVKHLKNLFPDTMISGL